MTLSTFVGREIEISKLDQILQQGSRKNGCIVFVEGEAGSGKSLLLQALQEKLSQQRGADKRRFVYGYCYEDSGSQNAYQPFVEILSTLLAKDKSKEAYAKLFLSIVKETGGDWLGMIPGIGPAISASLKTATIIAGQWLPSNESKSTGQPENLSSQYVQSISRIAEKYAPLVLVIEDAHWIDDASSRLLQRIAQKIRDQSLVMVITYRPSYLFNNHPLVEARNEIIAKAQAEVISLEGLNEAQIQEYIIRRFENPLNPKLATWLVDLCNGNPLFLTQYLSLLEQDQIIKSIDGKYSLDGELKFIAGQWELSGRLAESSVKEIRSIEALLEQRINRLVEEDQEMLQLGAVQGEFFMSLILADLLDKKETDILRRLRKVIEQHRLISIYTGSELDKTRTEVYTFEHILLQQAFYKKLTPHEQRIYHHNVAEQLAKMIQQEKTPSRKMLLDVAHHYDLGQSPQSAAEFYYLAAQSLMADGATIETAEIAKRGLRNINQVPEAYALKAKIIGQLLSASFYRIYSQSDEDGDLKYFDLTDEAKAAASYTADKGLMAQVKFLEAKYQVSLRSLTQAIATYREAIELIKQTQDPIGEYIITSNAGHHLCGENLRAGLDLQYEAQKIFTTQVMKSYTEIPSNLKQYYYSTQRTIGVNEFDLGNYSKAEELLRTSVEEFRKTRFSEELIWSLNFSGQLYTAMGAFEEAETIIKEAIAIDQASEEPSNCYCYNQALLGKLYLEWKRVDDAYEPTKKGFEESLRRPIKWELPLTRNYYIELLISPDFASSNLEEAIDQAELNIQETQNSNFHRSLIAALSLRAMIALIQKQTDIALDYSNRAVAYLEQMGTLPALRTEEILFNHYQVLMANYKPDEANTYLKQAHEVLLQKAESITNPAYRKSFMERVNLSRHILQAVNSM